PLFSEDIERLRNERNEAISRAEKAEAELATLATLREVKRRPRDASLPAGAVAPDTRSAHDPDTPAASGPPSKLTSEQRRSRVNEIAVALTSVFRDHEGEKALAYLKQLAALAPEGRAAAMKLALDI